MKTHLAVCLVALSFTLPLLVSADPATSSNPLVTATGSQMNSGGYGTYDSIAGQYVLSTTSDLLVGKTSIADTYVTPAESSYTTGWTAQEASVTPANNVAFLANLTDGNYGGELQYNGRAGVASGGDLAGSSATYNLGSNPNGYNLNDIEVYSGLGR